MARKVLINYHTSGSSAPTAADVFHGELVVAHQTSAETIFTKNNANEMVPFISCAQTIAIIDSKIQAADASYDVKAATGEAHLEVTPSTDGSATTFTLNTKDVQSEEEFKAYSAATKIRIDDVYSAETALTAVVSALTDVVLTGISGDTIIIASVPQSPTTGSNYVSLTHKEAKEVALGFNKVATDKYGHVIDYSAVTTADIQALGFKTSAETGEQLAELSASVVANETHISELSAGTQSDIKALSGDVVEYVKVVSGNIETVINELSAGTIMVSGYAESKINELSAGTIALVGASAASVFSSAKTYTDEQIQALDSSISASTGKYFTALAIEDGKLVKKEESDLPKLSVESAGTGNVVSSIAVDDHKITYQTVSVATSEDIQALSAATIALSAGTLHDIETLSGDVIEYVKVVSGNIETVINELSAGTIHLSADTKAAIEALSAGTIADNKTLSGDVVAYVNQLSGYAHGEIAELSASVVANETDIDNLSAATLALSAVTLTGVSLNDTPLTVSDHIVSVPVTTSGSGIANATDSGSVADAKAVKEYVQDVLSSSVDYKGATASTPSSAAKGDLYIASADFTTPDSKTVETGDFIIYNGSSWDVIEKNLDGAITGALKKDTVTLGDSTNSAKYLDNGAQGTVLTIGTAGTPEWANLPVLASAVTGNGNVVTDIAVNDHTITFTKGLTAATNAELEAVSGIVDTFSAATVAEFNSAFTAIDALSAGTIQLSADTKAAIAALSAGTIALSANTANKIVEVYGSANSYTDAAIAGLDSSGATSAAGNYLTSVTITDGKITAVGQEKIPAATPVTTVNGATGDTATAVINGIYTGGTDGHQLTLSATNKIFSAVTSESALTANSALTASTATTISGTITSGQVSDLVAGIENTKVHNAESADTAASADKVANKLTVTDVNGTDSIEYDGSGAKTITFGTTGPAGLDSMSMTNAGVVDVDVIDCGTY